MTSSSSRRNRFPQSKWREFFSLGKIHLFKFVKSTYIHYTYLIWFVADNISFLVYKNIYVVCALQHHHILLFQRYDVFGCIILDPNYRSDIFLKGFDIIINLKKTDIYHNAPIFLVLLWVRRKMVPPINATGNSAFAFKKKKLELCIMHYHEIF